MSLNMNGDRLLTEALADAMDRDLTDVPPREQLEKEHRFSGKFVRRMKQIETGKGEKRDFRRLGGQAKRYSGMAAVLVCVIGLAAVLAVAGNAFRSGASKSEGMDMAAADEAEMSTADNTAEAAYDDAETGDASEDYGDEGDTASPSDVQQEEAGEEPMAPDWQEQLLAESARADELASWLLSGYDDGTIDLESRLVTQKADGGNGQNQTEKSVRISRVYEVYYENDAGEWERVYHTVREMSVYYSDMIWGDNYSLDELNMNRSGRYRLVRQVNNLRQVLALTLD